MSLEIDANNIVYDFGGVPYLMGSGTPYLKGPPIMEKYRVRLLIDRLDKPGTETAEIHLGNVHTTDIAPILELAKRLTPEFGKLDEVAKK